MNQQLEETMNALMNAIHIKPNGMMIWVSLIVSLLFAMILWATYRLANTAQTYQPNLRQLL